MRRLNLAPRLDVLRRSFWVLPVVAMLIGGGLGFVIPMLDSASGGKVGIFTTSDISSARGLLETIAVVTVSVAGIAFSVTVVALQLASQQLGPRVLRTFQTDWVSQATLAVFLGVFVYALIALGRLSTITLADDVSSPNAVLTFGVMAAILAFGLFAAFIQNVVVSLQAATIIRRIASDASDVIDEPYPARIGVPVEDGRKADPVGEGAPIRARRTGFLTTIGGEQLLEQARECDGVVVQRARIGDFVVEGATVADAYGAERDSLADEAGELIEIGQERTLVEDVALPVRQLADVTLRALSPSLNDPTTAENAMGSIVHVLARLARRGHVPLGRADRTGAVRLVAVAPSFDDLVKLGFEQVSLHSEGSPVFRRRMLDLLEELRGIAAAEHVSVAEIEGQLHAFRG